jgi:hypothetical protein
MMSAVLAEKLEACQNMAGCAIERGFFGCLTSAALRFDANEHVRLAWASLHRDVGRVMMRELYQTWIEVNEDYDVIVAGGGPAGCAAATAAARTGAKTLLVEASGSLGGMGTIGLVPAWCPFSDKEKIIYCGIAQEVFEGLKAFQPHVKAGDWDWVPIDAEALKRVYDRLVTEAGVDALFNTHLCDAARDGRIIKSVLLSNKSGLTIFKAKIYVDCTGDADIEALSGVECYYSDKSGEVQPATLCFILSNVDEYAYRTGPELHSAFKDCPVYGIVASDKYPLVVDGHSCNGLVGPGTVGFNAGHLWDVDARDPLSVSKALIQGRELASQFHEGLKEFHPKAYASSFLASTAQVMGARESRRIIGEYTLTLNDFNRRASFPDEIGRNCYYVDVHATRNESEKIVKGELEDEPGCVRLNPGESHGLPYRSLVPKDLDNVVAAGKIISCDRWMLGSVRVMPASLVTGQAAGTAAALAAAGGLAMRDVPAGVLRGRLRADGAYLP